jgi:hypothetical protein
LLYEALHFRVPAQDYAFSAPHQTSDTSELFQQHFYLSANLKAYSTECLTAEQPFLVQSRQKALMLLL